MGKFHVKAPPPPGGVGSDAGAELPLKFISAKFSAFQNMNSEAWKACIQNVHMV